MNIVVNSLCDSGIIDKIEGEWITKYMKCGHVSTINLCTVMHVFNFLLSHSKSSIILHLLLLHFFVWHFFICAQQKF